TGSTEAQHTTSTAGKPKASEAKPKGQETTPKGQANTAEAKRLREAKAAQKRIEAAKPQAAAESVPRKKQYSREEQYKFMTLCEKANKGSHLTCECVLVKQELRKFKTGPRTFETGRSLAELLALEFALQKGVPLQQSIKQGVPFPGGKTRRIGLPREIEQSVKECVSA